MIGFLRSRRSCLYINLQSVWLPALTMCMPLHQSPEWLASWAHDVLASSLISRVIGFLRSRRTWLFINIQSDWLPVFTTYMPLHQSRKRLASCTHGMQVSSFYRVIGFLHSRRARIFIFKSDWLPTLTTCMPLHFREWLVSCTHDAHATSSFARVRRSMKAEIESTRVSTGKLFCKNSLYCI